MAPPSQELEPPTNPARFIRDKFAASKKKGIWMGGPVPLGYRVDNRKLVIEPDEAETVRTIFRRYLELGSLMALLDDLRQRGIVTKVTTRSDGTTRGGIPFARGSLGYLLGNRTYVGELRHKTKSHKGEHEPILDMATFEAVQVLRSEHSHEHHSTRESPPAKLRGLIAGGDGVRYVPIGNKRGALRYFRYVRTVEGATRPPGELPRSLAGPAFDAHVAGLLAGKTPDAPQPDAETLLRCVDGIAVFGKSARLILTAEGRARAGTDDLVIDLTPFIHMRRRRDLVASGRAGRPIRAETRATLLESIARARHWLDELATGTVGGIDELSRREGQTPRQITATLSCAFVAPDIVAAAIEGTLPDGAGVARMKDMPLEWDRQRRHLRL